MQHTSDDEITNYCKIESGIPVQTFNNRMVSHERVGQPKWEVRENLDVVVWYEGEHCTTRATRLLVSESRNRIVLSGLKKNNPLKTILTFEDTFLVKSKSDGNFKIA